MIKITKNPNLKKPILFADHDGVLVPKNKYGEYESYFSQNCVYWLNEIIYETDCNIIISSDWRLYYNLEIMEDFYKNEGIVKKPIGYTSNLWTKETSIHDCEKIRTKEILDWLKNNPTNKWCAIDDMKLDLENFVQCDNTKGITKIIKDRVVNYLK